MRTSRWLTKAERRERRRKPKMKVSGAAVKRLQRMIAAKRTTN